MIGIIHFLEPCDLGGIREAPARPEDDQDNLPFGIAESERLAVEVGSHDGRSRLTHQVDPFQTAGEKVFDGGTLGVFEDEPKGIARNRELVPLDQALVVGLADSDKIVGGENRPELLRLSLSNTFRNRLAQALERLFIGAAVGLGDDLDEMGQRIGRTRGSAMLDDVVGSRLGVDEKVTGNGQPKEPLVSGRGLVGLLLRGEETEALESSWRSCRS